MKKKLSILFVLCAALLLMAGCGRSSEFGYVDFQKIVTESSKVKELQTEIDNKIKEVQAADKADKDSLGEKEYLEKQKVRQSEMMVFQKEIDEKFKTMLNNAMNDVAKEKSLGAILVKDTVLQGGVDVTDAVLKKLN